jgi:hypothetical protein
MEPTVTTCNTLRPMPTAARRGNTLVLVTAILVLLVIIATAFLVRSQSGRAQAAAQQKAVGRDDRTETVVEQVAQQVADALFVRRIDTSSLPTQVQANTDTGLDPTSPAFGAFLARSDFPRLPPEPLEVRYGVDYVDTIVNRTLAQGTDNFIDGYNFAPFSTIPYTNWPARYGDVTGESNATGNPGFGDSRWLASNEPVRAMLATQLVNFVDPAPPGPQVTPAFTTNWGNLALQTQPNFGRPTQPAILSPEGLGFSHWSHLSWIATAENGFRVCWDISSLEGLPGGVAGIKDGAMGTALGELALGVPYEQWLPFVAPREPLVIGKDARGHLVLEPTDWTTRVRDWFNVGVTAFNAAAPPPHQQMITGFVAGASNPGRRTDALPNFLQLGAFGSPADEFKVFTSSDQAAGTIPPGYAVGQPTPRNLIARTLADADGDGWTDSLWFVAPTSSDRSTRQLVAVRIIDNSGMINVNTATRSDRSNTIGQTPSDVALVTRRESYDETDATNGRPAAFRDPAVGFMNARENDPEYRVNFTFRPDLAGTALPAASRLVYAVSSAGGTPTGGVDVGWNPARWEGAWRPSPANTGASAADPYQPSILELTGLVTAARTGQAGTSDTTSNQLLPLFDTAADLGITGSTQLYGDLFALTRANDRLTYFKAMANGGELIDPITASRIATLTPFGADDEIELRASNGLNAPQTISRLEIALNNASALQSGEIRLGQFLRSTRSREETSRFLDPDDVRVQDWRARAAWTLGATVPTANGETIGLAPRGGAELLLDHRRHLTTISGARNEMLPPRLWSAFNFNNRYVPERTKGAYLQRGPDFDGDVNGDGVLDGIPDGVLDDVTGDGAPDSYLPYHPNVVFYDTDTPPTYPLIPPGANNPLGQPVRDVDGNGRIDVADFELARQEFLRFNRKIDLRRPNDEPRPDGTPATASDVALSDRKFAADLQRVMRRALVYTEGDRSSHDSYFGRPGDTSIERARSTGWTKMMIASYAANVLSYRDGERPINNQPGSIALDAPLHPTDAVPVPPDSNTSWPNGVSLANAGFIGNEKQPFLMEVFIAFVFPKSKVTQAQIDAAVATGAGCPLPGSCLAQADEAQLPDCTDSGAGEYFTTYDPADQDTWPAVVFVAQVANPYEAPVKLADFELRINPSSGAPQRFLFALSDGTTTSGNTYGPNVELGPCTPEEPRTAIVFTVPRTFPNGEPFPRDAWLDFLDLGAPIDTNNDGVLSAAEASLADDSVPGGTAPAGSPNAQFRPDANALFEPAWGDAATRSRFARRGTLLFDATRTATYGGLDSSGNVDRWRPSTTVGSTGSPPQRSFIELRRFSAPSAANGDRASVVVDRWENELDVSMNANGDSGQRFVDRVERIMRQGNGGSFPPLPSIACRSGRLSIDGIRLGGPTLSGGKGDMWVAWARSARQWLFDTQNGLPDGTPGKGIITLDERTPRYVFARSTGTSSPIRQSTSAGTPGYAVVGGVIATGNSLPRGEVIGFTSPPDRAPGVGGFPPARWPTNVNYTNVWGVGARGKPTFFPTRIVEDGGTRTYGYPAWRLAPGGLGGTTRVNYGEKGCSAPAFTLGNDRTNFVAPLRMRQKDADFDQVAEILDVPLWGPLVERPFPGQPTNTWATLPEILAQRMGDAPTTGQSKLFFPKFALPFPISGQVLPSYGSNQAFYNRLCIDPMQFDTTVPPANRPDIFLRGTQTMPQVITDPALANVAFQDGIGFNSRLPGGAALLDAFVIDDRGAKPFDNPTWTPDEITAGTSVIDFAERAAAEDRRFRLARNFEGKLTPGLINVNTAPVEVLRAMPHMTRLVYDDDFPLAKTSESDPADLLDPSTELWERRTIREPLATPAGPGAIQPLHQAAPFDFPNSTNNPDQPNSIAFDYGVPAPRVRVAEAIDLWRTKGNVQPDLSGQRFADMPSYYSRGLDLARDQNHREWGPAMRAGRGFDSLGELALLTKGAEFVPSTTGDSGDADAIPDVQQIALNAASDVNRNGVNDAADPALAVGASWNRAVGWSTRAAGLDPFRTNWTFASNGAGVYAPVSGPATPATGGAFPFRTDGVPLNLAPGVAQAFPLSGRTSLDKHLLTIARDDPATGTAAAPIVETDDPATPDVLEDAIYRYDQTAGDAIEQNSLLKGISNIVTTRSDVFTVWVRVRTIRQDPLTGQWNGMDPENIIDDSRYMMTIDRSSVDRPGERARILSFVKVPK